MNAVQFVSLLVTLMCQSLTMDVNAFVIPSLYSSSSLIATGSATHTNTAASNSDNRFSSKLSMSSTSNNIISTPINGKKKIIAVTGATGRTGRLVVSQLLEQYPNYDVLALVRDEDKAKTIFNVNDANLQIVKCDLMNSNQVTKILSQNNCMQVIWCSTGFSSNPNQSIVTRVSTVMNALLDKEGKNSLDSVGLTNLAKAFMTNNQVVDVVGPNIIMLSSAGVTRPSWSESKKQRFEGCADIPIVRLNPFNILNIKANSEEKLRAILSSSDDNNNSGISYTIVRPTGLKDGNDWPCGQNARPIVSQGDVAVGRIHRLDVANVLLQCMECEDAKSKTFEVFSIAGYQPNEAGLSPLLKNLKDDGNKILLENEDVLEGTYLAMQQLLPGEKQDASALAMGQTYEELDADKVGRLGVKGEEKITDTNLRTTS
mmetsp:Transcript_7681/g.8778  ORF Transcript_7681/g.8778 Transcript_7681/m.8778 type:complete len:429 (+) Transcript_7681:294-1580(+)